LLGGVSVVSWTGKPQPAEDEVLDRIEGAKRRLGETVSILAHHYQRDEIVCFADHTGDSLELSRVAATARGARSIVFCGADFMAESAALLCDSSQTVFLPAESARCPMAGMADVRGAARAWQGLNQLWGDNIVPITYQNSSAQLKAFCGERGGVVCTSSNAGSVFRWALAQKGHILFLPDEHLGRNTTLSLGLKEGEIAVWDPQNPLEGQTRLEGSRIVVWKGYCYVHTFFTVEQVERAREQYPKATVIVHPECPAPVVARSDGAGSTSYMVRAVQEAAPGSSFVIGTETNLVNRLAAEHPEQSVVPLAPSFCEAMGRITPQNLLVVLEAILDGRTEGAVSVDVETVEGARLALERMLSVV
jgi:quinolinate synthase